MKDVLLLDPQLKLKKNVLDAGFQNTYTDIKSVLILTSGKSTPMLNLNTDQKSEHQNYHCHFMKFKNSEKFIYKVWEEKLMFSVNGFLGTGAKLTFTE